MRSLALILTVVAIAATRATEASKLPANNPSTFTQPLASEGSKQVVQIQRDIKPDDGKAKPSYGYTVWKQTYGKHEGNREGGREVHVNTDKYGKIIENYRRDEGYGKIQGYGKDEGNEGFGYGKAVYKTGGYGNDGYGNDGYGKDGYGKDGYNRDGYGKDGYNKEGYNREGYNREGYNRDGYGKDVYGKDGYGKDGYGKDGYGKDGYNKDGYNRDGYNRDGYGKGIYGTDDYGKDGYGKDGYGKDGYNRDGYNREGYGRGYGKGIYGKDGYGEYGYGKDGYNREGYGKDGYNRDGYNRDGYGRDGYGKDGYDYGRNEGYGRGYINDGKEKYGDYLGRLERDYFKDGYRGWQGRGRFGLGFDHRTLFSDSLHFPITPESYETVGRGFYRFYSLASPQGV